MSTNIDLTIASLAADQKGIVTRDQLLRAGLSRSTIWRRTSSGTLIPNGDRTFRVPSTPDTHDGAILAACLDVDGVASHRTAGWLHGLVERPTAIHVCVPRLHRSWPPPPARPGVVVHSSTDLPVSDITLVRGLPVFSVARTLMSLGALVPGEITQEELAELLALACERGQASERWLFWLLERRRIHGRTGTIAFEEALAAQVELGPTESWLERETLRIIDEAGLPMPRVQRRVERRGRFVGRVDLRYDVAPVVVEVLGYAHHRSRADLERDTRRANALTLAGNTVLQFGYDQVVRDPHSVVADIADALGIPLVAAA